MRRAREGRRHRNGERGRSSVAPVAEQDRIPEYTQLVDEAVRDLPGEYPAQLEQAVLRKIGDEGRPEAGKGVTDRREVPYVAIDPLGARDHDDAVWCDGSREEGWTLEVAIADVARWVEAGGALDREIAKRTTSVYLPDRVLHMTPSGLAEGACSLVAGEQRRAMVTRIEVAPDGTYRAVEDWVMRPCTVRVGHNMTYRYAEREVREWDVLCALESCARALRLGRAEEGGVLVPEEPEPGFEVDGEGKPVKIVHRSNGRAGTWIEEAMIVANRVNGEWLSAASTPSAVYRQHPEPKDGQGAVVQQILSGAADSRVKRQQVLKILGKAGYVARAQAHYGIGAKVYAHTTSPIRRYADLLCQRAAHALHGTGPEAKPVEGICERLNEGEVQAMEAERTAVKRWCAYTLGQGNGVKGSGIVLGVASFGIFVELDALPGVQGMTHVSELGMGEWVHDKGSYLEGEDTGKRWEVGTRVRGRLSGGDAMRGHLDFTPY